MVWLILGLMLGSLYAIVYGAVNLTVPLPPMSLVTFDAPAFLLGVAILLGLELLRGRMEAGLAAGKERIAHEHGLEHPALGPGRSDLAIFSIIPPPSPCFLYYIPKPAASQAVGSAGSSCSVAFRAAPCVRPIVSAGRTMRKRNACALLALSAIRGSSRRRSLRKLKSNRAQR